MRRLTSMAPALLVLVVIGAVLLAGPGFLKDLQLSRMEATMQLAQARLDGASDRGGASAESGGGRLDREVPVSRAVAQAVLPGVVHINVTIKISDEDRKAAEEVRKRFREVPSDKPDEESKLLEEFRKRFGDAPLPPNHPGIPSTGSGWLYDNAGHVVTNAHVVRDADDIRVELYDGRVLPGTVVGRDDATDVAVVAIDTDKSLFPLKRDAESPVEVGDRVFVFGSPFGFKFSMSQGIVSALGRSEAAGFLGVLGGYTNYIQTDAAMNPGNSGGPMVNDRGRVIGMNTAIANGKTDSGHFEQGQNAGLGFAIPIETVQTVADQLIGSGIVIRGYLGVRIAPPRLSSPEALARMGFNGRGVLVATADRPLPGERGADDADRPRDGQPESPATKAGIKPGDIVTAVAGKPVADGDVLRSLISIRTPGSRVEITVWREGKQLTLTATLGAAYSTGFALHPIPGGDAMSMEQLRQWVRGQNDSKTE